MKREYSIVGTLLLLLSVVAFVLFMFAPQENMIEFLGMAVLFALWAIYVRKDA